MPSPDGDELAVAAGAMQPSWQLPPEVAALVTVPPVTDDGRVAELQAMALGLVAAAHHRAHALRLLFARWRRHPRCELLVRRRDRMVLCADAYRRMHTKHAALAAWRARLRAVRRVAAAAREAERRGPWALQRRVLLAWRRGAVASRRRRQHAVQVAAGPLAAVALRAAVLLVGRTWGSWRERARLGGAVRRIAQGTERRARARALAVWRRWVPQSQRRRVLVPALLAPCPAPAPSRAAVTQAEAAAWAFLMWRCAAASRKAARVSRWQAKWEAFTAGTVVPATRRRALVLWGRHRASAKTSAAAATAHRRLVWGRWAARVARAAALTAATEKLVVATEQQDRGTAFAQWRSAARDAATTRAADEHFMRRTLQRVLRGWALRQRRCAVRRALHAVAATTRRRVLQQGVFRRLLGAVPPDFAAARSEEAQPSHRDPMQLGAVGLQAPSTAPRPLPVLGARSRSPSPPALSATRPPTGGGPSRTVPSPDPQRAGARGVEGAPCGPGPGAVLQRLGAEYAVLCAARGDDGARLEAAVGAVADLASEAAADPAAAAELAQARDEVRRLRWRAGRRAYLRGQLEALRSQLAAAHDHTQ